MDATCLISFNQEQLTKKTKSSNVLETNHMHELLLSIGIPPNINGYSYIQFSLELILQKPEYLRSVTKGLYIDVAKHFHTTPASVERSMRFAIVNTWKYGNPEFIHNIFKNCVRSDKGSPTNTVFLAALYYYIISIGYYQAERQSV